jgi:hypothetical protein
LGSLSGLGESATSHGQGQSGSSGSDSELLHTSNSCFYWKSAVTLVSRVTGDIANAVPTFSGMQIRLKTTSYENRLFSFSCKMHDSPNLRMQVAVFWKVHKLLKLLELL